MSFFGEKSKKRFKRMVRYAILNDLFDTKSQNKMVLNEGWQEELEDEGSEYGLNSYDCESAEDLKALLEEARYGWRKKYTTEWIDNYLLNPDNYETEEEFEEARNKAKYAWRKDCLNEALEYDLDPDDYETKEKYEEALYEVKYAWREECLHEALKYHLDPDNYETKEKYEEALYEVKYAWRKECLHEALEYDLDPDDYETKEKYEEALCEVKYAWREERLDEALEYDLDPDDYETEEEYEEELQEVKENSNLTDVDSHYFTEDSLKDSSTVSTNQSFVDGLDLYVDMETQIYYRYCGVLLSRSTAFYCYRTDDESIKIGDVVLVPVGSDQRQVAGIVVFVGEYAEIAVPYPVEKTKWIIRKLSK
jgi:hypothetical protein